MKKLLSRAAAILGIVFAMYCVGIVSVVWLAPESALADQLTGPLTISGNMTVNGDTRCMADLDVDVDINVDGDGVVDGTFDMNKALADTFKCASGASFQVRAADGRNDADLNVYDLSATNNVSASTFTGALTGGITGSTGSFSGDLTCAANVFVGGQLSITKTTGALPSLATVQALGTGTAYFRHFDTEPATGGTLFIWDDADTLFLCIPTSGTKAAN